MLLNLPLTRETKCIYIGRLIIHPIITFFFLFCFHSYNHWRDRFSGVCLLCPVYQARCWILIGRKTFRFSLYICVKFVEVAVENCSFDSVSRRKCDMLNRELKSCHLLARLCSTTVCNSVRFLMQVETL